MDWETLVVAMFGWQVIGFLTLMLLAVKVSFIGKCTNFDFFMPTYIYEHCKVNWFGAIILFLFVNLLCPVWSIGFWFYKLCTIGRK